MGVGWVPLMEEEEVAQVLVRQDAYQLLVLDSCSYVLLLVVLLLLQGALLLPDSCKLLLVVVLLLLEPVQEVLGSSIWHINRFPCYNV